jgi:hypothetical protein
MGSFEKVCAALLLGVLACDAPRTKQMDVSKDASSTTTVSSANAIDACLDQWLTEHQLDAFGSPEGTAYAGGTPTFDESSGPLQPRWDYLVAKHPALRRACDPARGRDH